MDFKKIVLIVLLVVAAGFGVYRVVKQHFTSEEAHVRRLMRQVERYFENKKLDKCLAIASDEYSDNFRHDTKDGLEESLRQLFTVARSISLTLEDVRIEMRGDEADIAVTATATASTMIGTVSLNEEAGHTRFVLTARKEGGRWKVLRAEGVD